MMGQKRRVLVEQHNAEDQAPIKLLAVDEAVKSRFFQNPSSFLGSADFQSESDRLIGVLAAQSAKVHELAQIWSRETGKVVYLINNLESGGMFHHGYDHWSTHLRSREDALEFTDRVLATDSWKRHIQLSAKRPSKGPNILEDDPLKYKDLAIIEVAQQFMREGRIDTFVYSVADFNLPSESNEPVYAGNVERRVKDITTRTDLKFMVADTHYTPAPIQFSRYEDILFRGRDVKSANGSDLDAGTDWMGHEVLFYDPGHVGEDQNYAGQIHQHAWWDRVPEIAFDTVERKCTTSRGRMTIKDFIIKRMRQLNGWQSRRQGWEEDVETQLSTQSHVEFQNAVARIPIKDIGPDAEYLYKESGLIDPVILARELSRYRIQRKSEKEPVRLLMIGVPGSGKTTIADEYQRAQGDYVEVISTGDVMFEIAKERNLVEHRDQMRTRISVRAQLRLQAEAVRRINERCSGEGITYLIHCHTTIETEQGFMPGLTAENFNNYNPDGIIILETSPNRIRKRALRDPERQRTTDTYAISHQQYVNRQYIKMLQRQTHVPVLTVTTRGLDTIPLAVKEVKEFRDSLIESRGEK